MSRSLSWWQTRSARPRPYVAQYTAVAAAANDGDADRSRAIQLDATFALAVSDPVLLILQVHCRSSREFAMHIASRIIPIACVSG